MLATKYASTPMPATLFVQGDNASDNKNWTLVAFFGMLVYHGCALQPQPLGLGLGLG
jgi:hypothetical protein